MSCKPRVRVFLLGVGAAGLLLGAALAWSWLDSHMGERMCRQKLINLAEIHSLYCAGHRGTWPASLSEMLREEDALVLGWCPAVGDQGRVDYVYVNWSKLSSPTTLGSREYPLFFDRRMSNHGGRGINIVLMNRHAFWDPEATWLKRMAAEHPEYAIPVPREGKGEIENEP